MTALSRDYVNCDRLRSKNPLYFSLIVAFILSSYFIFRIIFFSSHPYWMEEIVNIVVIAILFFSVCFFISFKTIYLFVFCYILPLIMFHFGVNFSIVYGLFDGVALGGIVTSSVYYEIAGMYVALSVFIIVFGWCLACILLDKKESSFSLKEENQEYLYRCGIIFLLVSIFGFFYFIYQYGNILEYKRVDFYVGGGDTRGLGLFMMFFPSASLSLLIGSNGSRQLLWALIICFIGFSIFMISGYRSAALFPSLVAVVAWHASGRKVNILFSISFIIIILVLIPASGFLRQQGKYADIDKEKIQDSLEQATIAENFRVMGQTGELLAKVFELVPNEFEYRYGSSYLLAVISSIPNIREATSEDPRDAARYRFLDKKEIVYSLRPSDWLTYAVDPDKFISGEGVGFTAIGEPYINFGLPGVVVYFLFLGIFLGWLDRYNILYLKKVCIFVVIFYWPLIRTVRNDFGNFIKPAFFFICVLLLEKLWRIIFSKNIYRKHV